MPKRECKMMEIGFRLPNRANRAQLLLTIGTGIFAAGALGFIAGYLSQGQTSILGALSLILTGVGSSMKRVKYSGAPDPTK
jgi:hypothetical protein